jgi:tRNA(Ile)-lysidine synthase
LNVASVSISLIKLTTVVFAPDQLTQKFITDRFLSSLPNTHKGKLLLAISGGKDSVTLLDLLLANGIKPALAHVNYQLRGEDSDADQTFVRDLAKKHGLKFHSWKVRKGLWSKLKNG